MAIPTRLKLTADDKVALAELWRFYEPIAPEIEDELRRSLEALPEWAPVVRAGGTGDRSARPRIELQQRALLDGEWTPYLADLREQGARYARAGISFLAWYDVIAIYREVMRRRMLPLAESDLERATRIGEGLTRYIDIAMAHLGEAYLATKEAIIAEQERAIRELSTPVLQIRDRLLVVPIVGRVDATRGRLVAEHVLAAIRDRRARGVVIDLTGVPRGDGAIATHLALVCGAARLMGARLAITGISAEMAQALTDLDARLAAETHVDLQHGVAAIEQALATSAHGERDLA
ncbi:MAG TPA: STAS domain-containing protein [Kofleriaceae bacterium]